MPLRKADYSMERIIQAPINKSQDAVLARSIPDRSRRHGRIEHSDAESHRESIATLLQMAYIQGSRVRENSVTLPVRTPDSHESAYQLNHSILPQRAVRSRRQQDLPMSTASLLSACGSNRITIPAGNRHCDSQSETR
jgi:hypothetical protein